ncbi:MAG: uroporphyrinogen-III C-methyltransferase [Chloroflexaceae bacterium]|nr:uroporphyrinogen-III C-methyltransferase [Chloroflexaceae bacterium]
MTNKIGKVYLVGAGPGNIAYLTLRARDLLALAEVIVYDALVNPDFLPFISRDCALLNVGKRGGEASTPQAEINQLLVDLCQQGKLVIRLKSGDPSIFGRINPEIQALKIANCPFELVPGISSAIAAPLLAGIPLTDKDLSRSFTVLSAHAPEILDWEALARLDTLVILMAGRSLPEIVEQLQQQGRTDPVAVIRNASRPDQEAWFGTLANIVEQTVGVSLSPAVIVVGKVVELGWSFSQNPSANLPLAGKTILITRAADQSSQFSQLLQAQGAITIEMPALEITPPSSWEALDTVIANLASFDWLILTSGNGANFFFERLQALGKDARALAGIKIAVVGKKTAATLKKRGINPDFIPPDFIADSLVATFPELLSSQKILFPRVESGGREVLVKELTAQGAGVIEVAAYESSCPREIDLEAWQVLSQGKIDVVTFASSKTVRNFLQLIEAAGAKNALSPKFLLKTLAIASIGPQTSQTCQELLGRVDIEAAQYTLEGLSEAIVRWSQDSRDR